MCIHILDHSSLQPIAGRDLNSHSTFIIMYSTKLMLHNVTPLPSTLMIGEATTPVPVVLSSVAKLLKV